MSVWLPVKPAGHARCILCGKAKQGLPQRPVPVVQERCAYTVELVKPGDPRGDGGRGTGGGRAELQGAA